MLQRQYAGCGVGFVFLNLQIKAGEFGFDTYGVVARGRFHDQCFRSPRQNLDSRRLAKCAHRAKPFWIFLFPPEYPHMRNIDGLISGWRDCRG